MLWQLGCTDTHEKDHGWFGQRELAVCLTNIPLQKSPYAKRPVWETSHENQQKNSCAFTLQYQLQVLAATDQTLQDQAVRGFS